MAALVADGWAGAENLEKLLCDGQNDQPTSRPTDKKVTYRIACPRLKRDISKKFLCSICRINDQFYYKIDLGRMSKMLHLKKITKVEIVLNLLQSNLYNSIDEILPRSS